MVTTVQLDESVKKRLDAMKIQIGNPEIGKPLTADLTGYWSLKIEKYLLFIP